MREQSNHARFRLTPIAASCMVAFVTACGGGSGGSGGSGGNDGNGTTTDGQTQAVATTTATQVSSAATGARTGSEAAEDFDEEALAGGQTALTRSLQERAQTLVDSGALAQQAGDTDCTNPDGSITVNENFTDGDLQGTEFVADNCRIVADEDEVNLEFTINGTQRVLANSATRDVKVDSDNFTASLEFSMDEIQDEDGNTIFPAIGPIVGDFESDGGYEASFSSNGNEFVMDVDWSLGFGMSCSNQGFEFGMESSDLQVTSTHQGSDRWDSTVDGMVAWQMSADVWDVDIDEEVTYETVQPLSAVGPGEPDTGELNVTVGGETVNIVYVQGGVEVDGEFYTHDELADMHEEELGADLEQELLGSCIDGEMQL